MTTRKIETVEKPPSNLWTSQPKPKETSKTTSLPASIEEWKDVVGFEGLYEVSSKGRVRSSDRIVETSTGPRKYRGKLLTPDIIEHNNSLQVTLAYGGQNLRRKVHQLVLEAFIGPRPENLEGCHYDGNAQNNNVENLRWDTKSSNSYDSIRHGTHSKTSIEYCPRGHKLVEPNIKAHELARGHRSCLACGRAHSTIGNFKHAGKEIPNFLETANKNYMEIMGRKHVLSECESCPLQHRGKHVPTELPKSERNNGLVFLGESPGSKEKQKGRPFIGPSGQLLDKILEHHGIKREETLLTNAALCNYADDEKSVLPEAIKCCRPRLLQELKNNNIHTAVTLGNAAAQSLLDTKTGITKLRGGDPKDSDYMPGLKVVPTLHPAYTMRDQGKFPLLLSDVGKVKPRKATWVEPSTVVIEDPKRALLALNNASTAYPYVLDVETGKEKEEQYSRTTNLLCVGLGSTKPDHNNRVVVIGRPAIHDRQVEDALIKLVSSSGIICQNGKFDSYILSTINRHKLPIYLVADTMLMSYSLNENPGTHGLKYMGNEYLGTPHWEDEITPYLKAPKDPPEVRAAALEFVRDALARGPQLRSMVLAELPEGMEKGPVTRAAAELQVREYKAPDAAFRPHQIRWAIDPTSKHAIATPEADGSYASIPPEILHKYNAFDVQVTRQLHTLLSGWQQEDNLTEFNKHLMVMANALMKVERNGLAVDYEFNQKLYDDFTDKLNTLRERLPQDINIGSPVQLKAHIEDAYGYALESTGEEIITAHINDPSTPTSFLQFCQDLLEYRRWSKLRSTYVTSIRKQALDNGGKVLPTFKIDQATTGRLASKNPNVQNMPRQFDIKRQFIPSRPDHVFVHADYSQLELRVITYLAKDEGMRALFNDPDRDLFDELTQVVYGMTAQDFYHQKEHNPKLIGERRVIVKAFAYGIILDRTAEGIADDPKLNLDEKTARDKMNIFNAQIPGIIKYQQQIKNDVIRGKDLVNLFGRRRRFHVITNQNKQELLRQAVAFQPQSTASDICVTALSRLPDYMDPRNIIHDDIVLQCPRERAHEDAQILAKTMIETAEEFTEGYVKFEADAEWGYTWADKFKFEVSQTGVYLPVPPS